MLGRLLLFVRRSLNPLLSLTPSTMNNFSSKVALITGGSSGIGFALARQLVAQGADVWILARNVDRLKMSCEELRKATCRSGQRIGSLSVDITNEAQTSQVLKDFSETIGAPDLLVNSAGITQPGLFSDLDTGIFRSIMEVNYFGSLYVTKALLPGMIARKSGHIVNISSIAGILGIYGYSAYGPSKFAIRGLSDSMRYELAEQGIRVSIVFPPDTQTPQLDYENQYKPPVLVELDKANKILSADAVAKSILDGVRKNRYVITPGFDSALYYHLTNFFGIVYPAMEFMVAQARRTIRRPNR